MMMFGLFCLVKIFRFFLIKKALLSRYRPLPEAKQDKKQISVPEAQEEIKVLWSELDLNLLGEIIARLTSPTDQARFRAVCKNWLPVHRIGNKTLLPWFLTYDRSIPSLTGKLELSLYEPSSTFSPTSVYTISFAQLGIPYPPSWIDIGGTCINNWLIFCTRVPMKWPSRYRRNFILFSPFTKKFIKLPQSDYPIPFTFVRTFSTDPTSPDCVFLLSDTKCRESRKIAILTYHNGDKEWTTRQFVGVDEFVPRQCFPIYFQGMFYLVSPLGQIISYNILNGELTLENLVIDIDFSQNYRSRMKYEVFELNGDLMLIYFGSRLNDNLPRNPCLKKFDWSSKVWMPVSSLGDHSLFVANRFRAVAKIKAINNEVLRNKIYYISASGCMVYSLELDSERKYFDSNFTYPNSSNYYIANGGHRSKWLDHLLGYSLRRYVVGCSWLKPPVVLYGNKLR
ncbi:hypothetical protein POM88_024208 [Heracleum sosnowskyi]|uniref:KIB1-4 beta-propeller domain-containing protein n=1 Tax=Heracleum sosnowskyi TaxID=360622 RepID=A0AAD8MM36_9APIA|nr:hypothetical protein POM88_024208 [Heracleum sosnowskyi]